MKRLAVMLGMVAVLGLCAWRPAGGRTSPPSIKKVMGKLHGKGKGLLPSRG